MGIRGMICVFVDSGFLKIECVEQSHLVVGSFFDKPKSFTGIGHNILF